MRAFGSVRQAKSSTLASDIPGWSLPRPTPWPTRLTPFVGLQIEYSLIERTPERERYPWLRTWAWASRPGRHWRGC